MKTYREYSFYEEISNEVLQEQFDEAYNYLEKRYPAASVIASDMLTLTVCDINLGTSVNFSLGISDGHPAIQNVETNEVVLLGP